MNELSVRCGQRELSGNLRLENTCQEKDWSYLLSPQTEFYCMIFNNVSVWGTCEFRCLRRPEEELPKLVLGSTVGSSVRAVSVTSCCTVSPAAGDLPNRSVVPFRLGCGLTLGADMKTRRITEQLTSWSTWPSRQVVRLCWNSVKYCIVRTRRSQWMPCFYFSSICEIITDSCFLTLKEGCSFGIQEYTNAILSGYFLKPSTLYKLDLAWLVLAFVVHLLSKVFRWRTEGKCHNGVFSFISRALKRGPS